MCLWTLNVLLVITFLSYLSNGLIQYFELKQTQYQLCMWKILIILVTMFAFRLDLSDHYVYVLLIIIISSKVYISPLIFYTLHFWLYREV